QKSIEFTAAEPTHNTNPYCSASPVTDGERVIVSHGSAGLYCYDFAGNEQWHRDLGPCHHIWGNAASPVIWNDVVFLNFGPGERTFLLAVDKLTGKDLWRAEESGGKLGDKGNSEWIGSWSTPVLAKFGAREELILSWPGTMKSYQPRTGEILWTCDGLFKDKGADKLVYTTPLVTPEIIVAMGGFTGAWLGMKPPVDLPSSGKTDITDTHRLWRFPSSPQRIGSGVIVGEHIYVVNEPGTAQCIAAKTGKILWTERLTSSTWASLVYAEGRLYTTSLDGESVVFLPNTEKLEVLARNKIPERTLASIAVSNGEFFLRTYDNLWCIRKSERK
ncbi:MAG: PQQ-binding-like beta-propeller repeat protein, partial [Planctomycetota bacterium]